MLHILAFNLLFRILAAQDNSQPQARQYQNIFDQPSLSPGHRDQAQIDPAAGQQWFYSSNRQPVAYSWYWSSNDQPSPSNFYKNTLPSDQAELLSAWACGRSQVANRFARIMGGQEAAPHSYPWMVSLAKRSLNNLHLCGGVLVTRRHILTAAHCIQDFKGVKDMNVFAGVHNINEKKNPVSPLTVDIHPQYEPETFANDVAVITLASPLPENDPRIGIVCLPPDDLSSKNYPPSKSSGVAIGWGSTSFGGRPSTALKQVVLPILPTERWPCNIYATHAQGQICAGDLAGGVDTCQADSGSTKHRGSVDMHSSRFD